MNVNDERASMSLVNQCKKITMLFAETKKVVDDWKTSN